MLTKIRYLLAAVCLIAGAAHATPAPDFTLKSSGGENLRLAEQRGERRGQALFGRTDRGGVRARRRGQKGKELHHDAAPYSSLVPTPEFRAS